MFNIYERKFKLLLLPIIIIIIGIVFGVVRGGFNFDTEFSGGTRMVVNMEKQFNNDDVRKTILDKTGVAASIQSTGNGKEAIIKFTNTDKKDKVFSALKSAYSLKSTKPIQSGELSSSYGLGMQKSALTCIAWACILLLIYITFRFEWRAAIIAILTLLSDVLCMIAIYLIFNLPINSTFVAAVLTVLGYRINDIIIVFDRIRENRASKLNRKKTIPEIAEESIWQTFTRSVYVSVTVIIMLSALYIMGVEAIKEFALPILIGVIIGMYESIFISAPMWAWWANSSAEVKKEAARTK